MPKPTGSSLEKQIRAVRVTLRQLDRRLGGLVAAVEKAAKGETAKSPSLKLRLSPSRRRALKVHGQYLGYIRQLKPRQKARVKKVRSQKGYPAAIAMAKKLAGR